MFNIEFDIDVIRAVDRFCKDAGIEVPVMLAVVAVESAGKTYAVVDGQRRPLIRWEGHYMHRLTKGKERDAALKAGVASPTAGAVKNPSSQAARWKLFDKAAKINRDAAIQSMSYGVGQVMGSHWKWLGYNSPNDFFVRVTSNVKGQLAAMFHYIEKAGLIDELQRKDFRAFARGYNGPQYAKQGYHTKMAKAYEHFAGEKVVSKATGMLRMGSKGARVRELQTLLGRAGHPVNIDGEFGTATKIALKAFQASAGIEADGVAGPATMAALDAYRQGAKDKPGQQAPTDVQEVKDAAKGFGVVALVVQFRDYIAEGASYLTGMEFETAQTVASYAMAGSAAIGAGLALYGLYGWLKSRRTVEGDL
jgi:hypothetical protein